MHTDAAPRAPFMSAPLSLGGLEFYYVSQPFYEGMSVPGVLPQPHFRPIEGFAYSAFQVSHFEFHSHMGTHIDAPAHFGRGGLTLDQLPSRAFYGEGVVLAIRTQAGEPIGADDLARALGTLPLGRGDMLLLSTGWAAKYGTVAYDDHPHLTLDAARWIEARGVKVLGIDFLTPDRAIPRRGPDFEHEVHRYLLPRGILIVENLASLERFEGRRVQVAMLPLYIRGGDGAPVCALVGLLPERAPRA